MLPMVTKHKIQKSTSLVAPAPVKPPTSEVTVIKHSKSSGKLERKVSFSEADPVKIGENGQPLPSKPKRSKDKKAHKDKHSKTANSKSSDTKKGMGDFKSRVVY